MFGSTFAGRMVDGIFYMPSSESPQSLVEEDSQYEAALAVSLEDSHRESEERERARLEQLDREQEVYQQNYEHFRRLAVERQYESDEADEIFQEEQHEAYLRSIYEDGNSSFSSESDSDE
jgi:hypothetical protein